MSPLTRPETTARRALWFGGLLIVLAGLFGMHGLDNHGAAGSDTIAHAMGSSHTSGDTSTEHSPVVSAIHEAGAAMVDSTVATGGGAMDMSMVAMCMAILVLALITLLRLMRSRGVRLLYVVTARPVRAPVASVRDRDPPSLILLSIQRC